MRVKRILLSFLAIFAVSAAGILGTSAFFSDTETSTGNVLSAGSIDLKIDNESYYNGVLQDGTGEAVANTTWELANLDDNNGPAEGKYLFFDFHDLKPGDWGEDTISLHVDNNPSWACMDLSLTKNDDVSSTEPELEAGDTLEDNSNLFDGELAQELNFIFWADDGDNVLETGENIIKKGTAENVLNTSWTLADSTKNVWEENEESTPLLGSSNPEENVYYVGKAWCFGTLTEDRVGQDGEGKIGNNGPTSGRGTGVSCDGSLTSNLSQTDAVMADLTFSAVQYRNNPSFKCAGCTESATGFATGNVSYTPGPTQNGGSVPSDRNDPSKALGAADGNFVSLGFGGEIVLKFGGDIVGNTLSVVEVTFGRDSYPTESVDVYVGSPGNWHFVGVATNHDDSGSSTVDVSAFPNFEYVRLVDTSNPADFTTRPTADGFDLDAVTAVVCLDDNVKEN
ncbi:hypothetical protein COV24_02695 [candidate division WWE3 bacterium CG10_big_fil_rev_8_21_14_0_10_32_10]|uniref:SipW-cognate class signal peptide n=1 Tax=candidate division WWE3 bacterium CG10_big_fil_rev_8_21_14_0_10_32_10 TaxID=1975090 RepID=A0A2H0RC73_UNCKA|nr:MAG: hypothetical protein COV24_02695 [candidate division WWE3 bacterium CG10_big_fil_rev_8_21_14_0_10_32_10]